MCRLLRSRFAPFVPARGRTRGISEVADTAELAGLEVLNCLPDLGVGVHYERPVVLYVLADGFTAEKKQFEVFRARVLAGLGRHAQPLALAKEHELTVVDWLALRPGGARTGEDVGERIEGRSPRSSSSDPGVIEACIKEMGVWVEPGPAMPAKSPAITRTRAPCWLKSPTPRRRLREAGKRAGSTFPSQAG